MNEITLNDLSTITGRSEAELNELNQHATVLLLDTSSSMDQDKKINQAKTGAKGFADAAIQRGSLVGLIEFNSRANEVLPLTGDLAHVDNAIAKLKAGGSTEMGEGIALAIVKLIGYSGNKSIFIVTDGMPQDEEQAIREASNAKDAGITVNAIGVDNANLRLLRELASDPRQPEIVSEPKLLGSAIKDLAKRIQDTGVDDEEF